MERYRAVLKRVLEAESEIIANAVSDFIGREPTKDDCQKVVRKFCHKILKYKLYYNDRFIGTLSKEYSLQGIKISFEDGSQYHRRTVR